MLRKKVFSILRRVLFLALVAVLLLYTTAVFERKSLTGAWNYTLKINGFYHEEPNSFDLLAFGSSHMYCSMDPLYIYEQTGLRSYVLATQEQPVEATYYYIKEALEHQSPSLVILEAYMYLLDVYPTSEAAAHNAVDSLPLSLNKLRMIRDLNTADSKENYYFNFMKYHTRWNELTSADFDLSYRKKTDPMKGFALLSGTTPIEIGPTDYSRVEALPLAPAYMEYLEKTVKLIQDSGSEVLLYFAPYIYKNPQQQMRSKALHQYAQEAGLHIVDMNLSYTELGFDSKVDFYDKEHLNMLGAEKASLYLANYAMEHFSVSPRPAGDSAKWEADLLTYRQSKSPTE